MTSWLLHVVVMAHRHSNVAFKGLSQGFDKRWIVQSLSDLLCSNILHERILKIEDYCWILYTILVFKEGVWQKNYCLVTQSAEVSVVIRPD